MKVTEPKPVQMFGETSRVFGIRAIKWLLVRQPGQTYDQLVIACNDRFPRANVSKESVVRFLTVLTERREVVSVVDSDDRRCLKWSAKG